MGRLQNREDRMRSAQVRTVGKLEELGVGSDGEGTSCFVPDLKIFYKSLDA
jgi:hypothetical protein